MPIYEYACPECGERVEKMKSVSSRAEGPECPTCGETMVLALSAPGRVGVGGGAGSGGSLPQVGGCSTGTCGTGFT